MSTLCSEEALLERWRNQIGERRPYRRRRPLAALGYLRRGNACDSNFIELRQLLLVALYDEPIGRRAPALRLVGYAATQIEHGVQWGGFDNCRFYTDLRISPEYGGSGLQLDSSQTELLQLALRLKAELYRLDRFFPKAARSEPILPRVWAAFTRADAASLTGDGPELAALCEKFDLPPASMLRKFEREHGGLACFPIEWVSGALRRTVALFADLSEMPRVQVFRIGSLPGGLTGYSGAAAFDFYHGKQRQFYSKQLQRSQQRSHDEPTRLSTSSACSS